MPDPAFEGYEQSLESACQAPMSVPAFLSLAIRVAAAVGDLHAQGVIHKDIKPANLIVESTSHKIRILDSGIATRAPRERQLADHPTCIQGTLAYMSPEQTGRMNRLLDYRTDLYSLGVTFYQLLTGRLPFQADTALEWVYCHIAQTPRPPSDVAPHIPGALSSMVVRLLAKMAEDRYQSARSLQLDLETCASQWAAHQQIAPFALGQHDASERFQVPQRLYGRGPEVAALLAAFNGVMASGRPALVLVSGYSGIGKSSLMHELQKPVLGRRGFFVAGKCEQYGRDVPFASTAARYGAMVQQLLASSEDELDLWRHRLRTALGNQGQLICAIIPALERIIGPQPAVPEVSPLEAQTRLHQVFGRFLGVFATAEHPMVVCMDDLQWADPATLPMLQSVLSQPDSRYLMVVGAYRDNEVGPDHPLRRTVDSLRKTLAPLEIVLQPLDIVSLRHMVADTIRTTPEAAAPLAALVLEKTAGNPFFVEQFLMTLHDEHLIMFDRSQGAWSWDLASLRAANVTDNVVELMVNHIVQLGLSTRTALMAAACIGHQFEVEVLARVLDQPVAFVLESLQPAVLKGLVLSETSGNESLSVTCRWLHDRVQQAAYSLIAGDDMPRLHLTIGQTLRHGRSIQGLGAMLFEVVNHLNIAAQQVTDRVDLAQLNLAAARKAITSAAFSSARSYLAMGHGLLCAADWDVHYDLIYPMVLERARCESTCGSADVTMDLLALLKSHARGRAHLADAYRLQLEVETRQHVPGAVEGALKAWRALFGHDAALHPSPAALRDAAQGTLVELGSRPIEDLVLLPIMSDADTLAEVALLSAALPPAWMTDPRLHDLLCCHMVCLSLRHGNADSSAHGYVAFGAVLGRLFERWEDAFRFGRVGLALVAQRNVPGSRSSAYFVTAAFIDTWVRPVAEVLPLFHTALDAALEAGDMNLACYAGLATVILRLFAGHPLELVAAEIDTQLDLLDRADFSPLRAAMTGMRDSVLDLQGRPVQYPDDHPLQDELEATPLGLSISHWTYACLVHLLRGDTEQAVAAVLDPRLSRVAEGMLSEAEYCFYAGLALARHYDQVSAPQQQAYLATLHDFLERFRIWQLHGPHSFGHRYALLEAEMARIDGRVMDALHAYERAVRLAKNNGFPHHEALACEMGADFCRAQGFDTFAAAYARQAMDAYQRWGAAGQIHRLQQRYPMVRAQFADLAPTRTLTIPNQQLDVLAALKAAQAISGEIVFSRLLETLMQTLLEHVGAERGILLRMRGDELWIEAEAGGDRLLTAEPGTLSDRLPGSVVAYVRRTLERVILGDAAGHPVFGEDPYFQRTRPRSVLCLPLVKQARLVGMLYAENNLATDAFTTEGTDLLEVLASQAAISLENAALYEELEQRVQLRTQMFEQSEERYHALVDASVEAICMVDPVTLQILFPNPAFLRLLGYTLAEIEGLLLYTLVPEDAAVVDATTEAVLQAGALDLGERVWKRRTGERLDVHVTASTIHHGDTRIMFVVARDITARRQAEAALRTSEEQFRQVQKMDSIGRLAGGIAHEFNNLLTAVTGYCSLVVEQMSSDDPRRDEVHQIERAGNRMAWLTQQLLGFSRRQDVEPKVLDLNEVVQTQVRILARVIREDVALETVLTPGVAAVCIDPGLLDQVVMNLAVNARDAMPQGGTLKLEVARVLRPGTDTGVDCEWLRLRVQDTGVGMDTVIMGRVFEPFFTTKEVGQGTGLGLAATLGIVQQAGGEIRVDSRPGHGACFDVYLPAVAAEASAALPVVALKSVSGHETILVVEDEEWVRRLVQRVLSRQGFKVLQASDGAEALGLCRQQEGPIDLVLTDIVMPGMNGREVARQLSLLAPETRFLFMSGYTREAMSQDGSEPLQPFLSKPFSPDMLLRKVREILDLPCEGRGQPNHFS